MYHIVFLDSGARELEHLINGSKSMILRGADHRQVPYGMVREGDEIFFIESDNDEFIRARGEVTFVYNSGKLTCEESFETIIRNQDRLQLPDSLFYAIAGKKYLVLVGLGGITEIEPVRLQGTGENGRGDWIIAGSVNSGQVKSLI